MINKRTLGSFFEQLAVEYITSLGCSVVETNYRPKRGDIDIIARDGEYLCFIEVKYRKNSDHGEPEEAVTLAKQRQICRLSKIYLYSNHYSEYIPIRYDVIAVTDSEGAAAIKWIKNAFDYIS